MLQAVIFDFDGVVTDSEPVHFHALVDTLRGRGIEIDWQTYCEKYLAYDDRDLFQHVLTDAQQPPTPDQLALLLEAKNAQVLAALRDHLTLLPGVAPLLEDLARHQVPIAICSGARRNEVELFLEQARLRDRFRFLVTADDVIAAKPDPEGYRRSLEQIAPHLPDTLVASRCVAIEDSPGGLRAARAAGMTTLAVAQGYPDAPLVAADLVVDNLTAVDTALLTRLVENRPSPAS